MYEVVDNFLDKEELESLESVLLSKQFPWFLNPQIDKESSYYVGRLQQQFSHTVYAKDYRKSDWLPYFYSFTSKGKLSTTNRKKSDA